MNILTVRIKNISLLDIVMFFSLLALLYLFENSCLKLVGTAAMLIILAVCVVKAIVFLKRIKLRAELIIWLLTAIYVSLHLFFNFSQRSVYFALQMLFLLSLYIIFSPTNASKSNNENAKKRYGALFTVLAFLYAAFVAVGCKTGILLTAYTLPKCMFPLSFFAIDFKKNLFAKMLFFAVFASILGERTIALCIGAVYVFYTILKKHNSGLFLKLLFVGVASFAILLPVFYISFSQSQYGEQLNLIVKDVTKENLFSGRNRIWPVIFAGLSSHEAFGLGFGNNLLLQNDISLSTHNVYMYLYMCGGLVLTGLFLCFLYIIWREICIDIDVDDNKKKASYFLGLLISMDFELFMVANNMPLSLLWWLVLCHRPKPESKPP